MHSIRPCRIACGLLLLLGPGLAAPTAVAESPRVWAITGATVVPEPGRRIDDATVVIRDGMIAEIGSALAVPPDATEVDAEGGWVYAGLIDADSRLAPFAEPTERRSRGAAPAAPASTAGAVHPLSKVRPETRARDRLIPFEGDRGYEMRQLRELGFTTVLAAPDAGLLRGRSVAILLLDDVGVPEMILRDDVAQHAAFERGSFGDGYPTSLMGAAAALRQTLLDADRWRTWSERYATDPRGMRRPEHHAAFEALGPLVTGDQPLFLTVDSPHDALLGHRIAEGAGVELVLSGSGHEWEIAERLAGTGRSMLLPVARPDKPAVREAHEALEVSRRTMRRYLESPSAAARLHDAGVRFALVTRGLKNTADFPDRVREMIEAGLTERTAVAALTTIPAALLGIDRMVGTIETGKIANLVLATGPLFEEATELREIFVDGRRYEIEQDDAPKGDPDAVVDPRGTWSVVFTIGGRTVQREWKITGDADAYEGTAETRGGTVTFESVELAGNAMTVVFPATGSRGTMEVTVIVIEGNAFRGVAEMGPRSMELEATRTSGPGGGVEE